MREDQIIKLAKQTFGQSDVETIPNIGLKSVLKLSSVFPSIKIANETLWAVANLEHTSSAFVLTSKHLHLFSNSQPIAISLNDSTKLTQALSSSSIDANHKIALQNFLKQMQADGIGEPQPTSVKVDGATFDDFVDRVKSIGKIIEERANQVINRNADHLAEEKQSNPKPSTPTPSIDESNFTIQSDYLLLLQEEGNALLEIAKQLNEDKTFTSAMHKALSNSDVLKNDFGAQHIILQDLIRIYNLCDTEQSKVKETKAKFALAYLFERMQEKDMVELLTVDRINEMVEKQQFQEGIDKIKSANYLQLPDEYKKQLLLPSLLNRLEHHLNEKTVAHYIRFANLIVKADGEISEAEEEQLKQINRLCTKPKINLEGVKQSEVPEDETLEDVLKELNQLIGLKNIKEDIESLTNFLKIQKVREEQGLKSTDRTLHAVFMGPPGTGKTTVARLLSRIYYHLGYLDNGHLVETDRAGLVAGYVGQTAIKVKEVVDTAIDGVLFIDEAYALSRGDNGRDFGNEAVETLLKRMEDHRKDLSVIVAGYPNEMEDFIKSNPGLKSRFNRYFKFNHYNGEELLKIFKLFAGMADFKLDEEANEKLLFIFEGMYAKKDEHFGNARVARNLFEECVANQANRIVKEKELTKEVLTTLKEADVPPIKETIKKYLEFGEVK